MVELIPEARAARAHAGRLRAETLALKLSLRESGAHAREQLRAAEDGLTRARARRYQPLPSQWSTLSWACDDEVLDLTLVLLP